MAGPLQPLPRLPSSRRSSSSPPRSCPEPPSGPHVARWPQHFSPNSLQTVPSDALIARRSHWSWPLVRSPTPEARIDPFARSSVCCLAMAASHQNNASWTSELELDTERKTNGSERLRLGQLARRMRTGPEAELARRTLPAQLLALLTLFVWLTRPTASWPAVKTARSRASALSQTRLLARRPGQKQQHLEAPRC